MWTSESLLFQFSILVVTDFVGKGTIFDKALTPGAVAKLVENLLLIHMLSCYLQKGSALASSFSTGVIEGQKSCVRWSC